MSLPDTTATAEVIANNGRLKPSARNTATNVQEQMQQQQTQSSEHPSFAFPLYKPFATFTEGRPTPTAFLVDGLLPEYGFSIVTAKPKQGKSSLMRYLAVSVAKGNSFLGRTTTPGETLLISLEDQRTQVDNHLHALGYDPEVDAALHITDRLAPTVPDTLAALRDVLRQLPNVRLVIVDHLSKWLRVRDIAEYMVVQQGCQALRDIAKEFRVHIVAVAHSKKSQTSSPFDGILGSTAMRGETDSTFALYEENGQRVIAVETRAGMPFPPSILDVKLCEVAGTSVVQDYLLSLPLDDWEADKAQAARERQLANYAERVMDYLDSCEGKAALQSEVLAQVEGKTAKVIEGIKTLVSDGVLTADGSPRVLTIDMDSDTLALYRLGKKGRS